MESHEDHLTWAVWMYGFTDSPRKEASDLFGTQCQKARAWTLGLHVAKRLRLKWASTHMFLFKARSPDYHDWCVHPPSCLPVQRLAPSGSGGEAFPLNRTVDFPQGNFPILPLIRSPVFPSSR
ncbi:unnamed protein product [Pleuronectes platessa]|uniref:Uncharacterized protein n=1 Tax=Pleuronectes platessa TaxID=8262 RepID=A0A9N7VGY0_PLEPL|nr:unnamed protein product [Pleuronectes platessa]